MRSSRKRRTRLSRGIYYLRPVDIKRRASSRRKFEADASSAKICRATIICRDSQSRLFQRERKISFVTEGDVSFILKKSDFNISLTWNDGALMMGERCSSLHIRVFNYKSQKTCSDLRISKCVTLITDAVMLNNNSYPAAM